MKYIFFSLRNFEVDAGESVRIYGLLNSLASSGNEVIFISNAEKYGMFHSSIKHVFIDYEFKEKRNLQGLLALFPYQLVVFMYKPLFDKIRTAFASIDIGSNPVCFFDYLDNSIGFILKRIGLITNYVNDIHGIATLEFLSHIRNAIDRPSKILYTVKYRLAYRLDRKVFRSAFGLIYGSEKMKRYYQELYNLRTPKEFVIPYLLGEDAAERTIDAELKSAIEDRFCIAPDDFVVLFVGTYKSTAGVDDLIGAFDQLFQRYKDCKLILIGGGPMKNHCVSLSKSLPSNKNVYFIDHIPYSQLLTFQSIAKVVVCPDKDNLYSQYVVHVKYLDALMSGRVVINGAFDSVAEINKNDLLSLSFRPSDVQDLFQKLVLCKDKYEYLMEKYKGTRNFAIKNLTYRSYVRQLVF